MLLDNNAVRVFYGNTNSATASLKEVKKKKHLLAGNTSILQGNSEKQKLLCNSAIDLLFYPSYLIEPIRL